VSKNKPVAFAHSRVANLAKKAKKDPAAKAPLEQARRDLAAAKLAAYIAEVVEAAPSLDAATRDRLALLLRGAGVTS